VRFRQNKMSWTLRNRAKFLLLICFNKKKQLKIKLKSLKLICSIFKRKFRNKKWSIISYHRILNQCPISIKVKLWLIRKSLKIKNITNYKHRLQIKIETLSDRMKIYPFKEIISNFWIKIYNSKLVRYLIKSCYWLNKTKNL